MDVLTLVFLAAMLGVAGVIILALVEFIAPALINEWVNKLNNLLERFNYR